MKIKTLEERVQALEHKMLGEELPSWPWNTNCKYGTDGGYADDQKSIAFLGKCFVFWFIILGAIALLQRIL